MRKVVSVFLVFGLFATVTYAMRLDAIGWFLWHTYLNAERGSALKLSTYQAVIDAKQIPGITDASDLTYHAPSGTLFSVLNDEPTIVQLSTQGEVLRKIRVEGVSDMEGIAHITADQFVLVEESRNRMLLVTIGDESSIRVADQPQVTLDIETVENKGLEGVAWDSKQGRVLVVSEKYPKRFIEIRGFINSSEEPEQISLRHLGEETPAFIRAFHDLASISTDERSGHLLLLSEESRLIKEFDESGGALSALLLWKGFHGLKETAPQAEGIAIGPEREIYVISEPNLFYVFRPGN